MTDAQKAEISAQIEQRTGTPILFMKNDPTADLSLIVDWDQRFTVARAILGDPWTPPVRTDGPDVTHAREVTVEGSGSAIDRGDGWIGYSKAVIHVNFGSPAGVDG